MRRTWTLLLVAVLLAVFLAVPAMASEEEHTSHTGWDKLTASTTLKDGGKYYLEGDLTASFTVTEGEITVCLNGKAWSGDGTRPLAVTGGTVNICDCKHTGADADTGAIVGATLASSLGGGVVDGKFNGGAVTVTSGTVNFYSGIIRDGTGGSGGNVAVNGANSEFNMHGGIIRGGRTLDDNVYHGGNVRLSNEAVFNLYDGLVTGGEAKNGGGNFVLVGTATKLNIYGGTITDGTAKGTGDPGGGNIYIHEGTVTMEAGTVSGGTSKYMGGNVYLRNGTFHMKSGVVSGGTAKDPASAPNIYVNHGGAEVTLERDARVYGGMDAANAMTVTLKGTPIVDKALTTEGQSPAYSLRLASGRLLTLDGLKAGARVGITGASPATGVVICNAVGTSDYSGIRYDTDAFYIRKTADAKLDLAAAAEVTGAAVNHGSIVYSLEEAVTLAGKGGYVRLVNSLTGPTISQSVSVDLNGYDITNLTLAENACLTLFDSSTADYEVEVDETSSNGYSGYGTVTLADGSPANILRQGNTSKDTYGYNYRFVAVKDGEGYHAHRIYLTVKSTILYPNKPALTYRTALRCDQLVAAYINAAGGGFGILASAEELGKSYGDYTDNGYEVLPWNSKTGEQNERVTYLNEILEDPDATAENTLRATTKVRAQAYIFLADAFYGSRLAAGTDDVAKATNAALITDEAVTSSGVSQSLQNMVELAFAKSPATLSSVTRDAMCDMYTKWSTNLMETWSLQYLQDYMDGYDGMTLKYGCLCGKPSSKDNPCAAGGHVQLTWSPWDSSTNNFPSESGNYYLTEPLVLKNQGKVDEDVFINLNTNGHNISVEGKVRASLVHGVLNLTNFGYDGAAVAEVRVTATCNMDGNGGVLLIAEAGNVSLYSGVTLAAQANHNITKGVVGVAGDLNIYGGRIEGTTLKTVDKEGKTISSVGGAIYVNSTGYLYMNSGEIVGGTAIQGGAIHNNGVVELAGGTIIGGTADDGGNVRMAGKNSRFIMTGGEITGGISANGCGGGFLLVDGTLEISGKARITGNTDGTGSPNNVYLSDGKTMDLGELASTAKIGITMETVGGYVTGDNTENTKDAIINGRLESDEGLDMDIDSGDSSDFYIGKHGCICGATSTEPHIGECHETQVLWYPWTDETHLPNEAGYWYLAYEGDVTVRKQAAFGSGSAGNVDVVVDLNGKTVARANTGDDNRFFAVESTDAEGVKHSLTITDSSVGHNGKLICADSSAKQGMGVWLQDDASVLNLYRGTIDAGSSTATAYGGPAIYVGGGHVNMYGGKLVGGTTYKDGGTVYLAANTSFTMFGGEILGGRALCKQLKDEEKTVTVGGVTYTYTTYKCSDHGCGGAVCIAQNAAFSMSSGTVTAPEHTEENHFRGAGRGGLFYVAGTLDLSGDAEVSGGSVDGLGAVNGEGDIARHDCGYGGNIYIEGGTVNMSGSVTVSDGYAHSGKLADGTAEGENGEILTWVNSGTPGGGLGGNISVSGTLNLTGGTVKQGVAITGGNIGTHSKDGVIKLGVAEGKVSEKAVKILNGTAFNNGGNLAVNVRPCMSFVINQGTWIEGGRATNNGGNISINVSHIYSKQAVATGTSSDGTKIYETEYYAGIVVNGGTITDGVAGKYGGNIYANGKNRYKSAVAQTVNVHAKISVGAGTVISNGAAAVNGNNLYLGVEGVAVIGGTIRNTLERGTFFDGTENEYTVGENSVYIEDANSELTLEDTGSIVNEKAVETDPQPYVRNLYLQNGSVTMNGGQITGGALHESSRHGGNVYIASGTLTISSGQISGGLVESETSHGGNLYVAKGTVNMSGGQISGGTCLLNLDTEKVNEDGTLKVTDPQIQLSGKGGNIYIAGGSVTLSGTASVSDGKVAGGGGNIYVAGPNTKLIMEDQASVSDGLSTRSSGGNIFVRSGTFTLKDGTVSGGRTYDGGGNVYANGTFRMEGGLVTGGQSSLRWKDTEGNYDYSDTYTHTTVKKPASAKSNAGSANVFLAGKTFLFDMSGGEISTGVAASNQAVNSETEKPVTIILSGTAKIGGTGLSLEDHSTGLGYLNTVDVSGLQKGAEVYISCGSLGDLKDTPDYLRLEADTTDPAYTLGLVKSYNANSCQVVYMTADIAPNQEAGIYLYNGAKYRFHCLCGANEGESHLPDCDGQIMEWRAWIDDCLPNIPGNWFLYYGDVKQKRIKTGSLRNDFYKNEAGEWVAVRALMAVDEKGSFTTLEDKRFLQAVDSSGKKIWLNTDGSAIDNNADDVVTQYAINVDLNGYELEGPSNNRNLTFYGRYSYSERTSEGVVNEKQAALIESLNGNGVYAEVVGTTEDGEDIVSQKISTHRQAKVTYTIVDASQGHTAVLATYGRFNGKTRTASGDPQGTNIWMYWQEDTLNTYRTTIDASSVRFGWGVALEVEGTANLYDTTVIGGVAQGYFYQNELTTGTDSAGNEVSGYVKTIGGNASGGGAVHVCESGTVNMYGGTIKNGTAIYRYTAGSDGVNVERTVGGGNVFVEGIFNVEGTAEYPAVITGGKALNYTGEVEYALSAYTAAQGGGVYLHKGKMTVTGNVSIKENYTGTVTGTVDETNGTGRGIVAVGIVNAGTPSNLFLGGNIIEAKALTGKVYFTMNPAGSATWEGAFSKVDTNDTSYVDTSLIPDIKQDSTVVLGDDGILRFAHSFSGLQVGYGSESIYPEEEDIANGLPLGGYGNTNYSFSDEKVRITRYWENPGSGVAATDPDNHNTQDMLATAMAFRDMEGDTVIIINVDYNSISESIANNVKRLVSKKTGVPLNNITISASHQHNGPSVSKVYWTDRDGNYTKEPNTDRQKGTNARGTYESMLYSGVRLQAWEKLEVRTDYATTFYTNVLAAAVEAYADLADVTAVTGGVMDTTTGGNQFNFVRNIALYEPGDLKTMAGMITDNHYTTYSVSSYTMDYESAVDVTMQLVKYMRKDKTIVLANFQSHPHLGDGCNNLNATGGTVQVFRKQLSDAYRKETGKQCDVLYFSGAGGNVNSSTSIDGSGYDKRDDTKLHPWYQMSQNSNEYRDAAEIVQKSMRVVEHGNALATLANSFLKNGYMTTQVADLKRANVQASVEDFTYAVWNEKQDYRIGNTVIPATWSDTKLANAKLLVNWEKGGYLDRPGKFDNTNKFGSTGKTYWQYFAGNYMEKNHQIYSFFHAEGVRKRLLTKSSTGSFQITAYDLGGIGFIAAPYEMFQENGQAIKGNVRKALQSINATKYADYPDYVTNGCGYIAGTDGKQKTSPYGITIIASQANAAQGYIPSVLGYINGGYSTDTSLFAPGTGEELVTAYVDMLIALKGE